MKASPDNAYTASPPRALRIVAPHFIAGIEKGGAVAPIIKYMKGWTEAQIREYCRWKGWEVEAL